MSEDDLGMISGWFAGPKGENSAWFNTWLGRVAEDYCAWRRNYFPEDAVVVDSALRRHHEPFADAFEDRVLELLARLKADVPFHSPRYAAHMLAEQTLPGVIGYFAAMLYNPNNVTADVAPVTVKLELEAGQLLARMIGYDAGSWAHLCSGGTAANIEALWVARTVKYLPLVIRDVCQTLGLIDGNAARDRAQLLQLSPRAVLESYSAMWREIHESGRSDLAARAKEAVGRSGFNIAEQGMAVVSRELASEPVLLVPESHHYCFEKALDLLGMGRRALRSVRVDEHFRMLPEALEEQLDRVDREGSHVLAVVAVVGSTEEGSIDPVDKIVAIRRERENTGKSSFWLHGDGAYGGYLRTVTIPVRKGLGEPTTKVKVNGQVLDVGLTLPEHGECAALEQMAMCDSVTIDPHKLGYIPYPAGAICFKSNMVKPLMRQAAAYLEDAPSDPETERTSESIGLYVLEGSKPGASAAAVWLSHSLIPLDSTGHGRLMRENIRNACELHALLEGYPKLGGQVAKVRAVCLCPPGSNIVCYAFAPDMLDVTLAQVNALNRRIFERFSLNAGQRVYEQSFFVSRTSLSAKQYSLATVGSFLSRLGVNPASYQSDGVFLLRSVLMNPWYGYAKRRGRYYLSELVAELYAAADEIAREVLVPHE
jgi:glutamate/tyrosine decarboxylase-like PLP-dependent enzyme